MYDMHENIINNQDLPNEYKLIGAIVKLARRDAYIAIKNHKLSSALRIIDDITHNPLVPRQARIQLKKECDKWLKENY